MDKTSKEDAEERRRFIDTWGFIRGTDKREVFSKELDAIEKTGVKQLQEEIERLVKNRDAWAEKWQDKNELVQSQSKLLNEAEEALELADRAIPKTFTVPSEKLAKDAIKQTLSKLKKNANK